MECAAVLKHGLTKFSGKYSKHQFFAKVLLSRFDALGRTIREQNMLFIGIDIIFTGNIDFGMSPNANQTNQ